MGDGDGDGGDGDGMDDGDGDGGDEDGGDVTSPNKIKAEFCFGLQCRQPCGKLRSATSLKIEVGDLRRPH